MQQWFGWMLAANILWSLCSVLNSSIIRRTQLAPFGMSLSSALVSVSVLVVSAFFLPLHTSWAPLLATLGFVNFLGDLCFYRIVKSLDISLFQLVWIFVSVELAIVGVVFLGDAWSFATLAGVVAILAGSCLLTIRSSGLLTVRGLLLLFAVSLLFFPTTAAVVYALRDGVPPFTATFWILIVRDACALLVPLLAVNRKQTLAAIRHASSPWFWTVTIVAVLSYLGGIAVSNVAYEGGPASLVAIVGDLQPFFVLAIAGFFHFLLPSFAALEDVSPGPLIRKILAFSLTFIGLLLLPL